jgi:hypothetical protein
MVSFNLRTVEPSFKYYLPKDYYRLHIELISLSHSSLYCCWFLTIELAPWLPLRKLQVISHIVFSYTKLTNYLNGKRNITP